MAQCAVASEWTMSRLLPERDAGDAKEDSAACLPPLLRPLGERIAILNIKVV